MKHRKRKRSAWIDFLLVSSIITLTAIIIITISMTGQFKFQKTTVAATSNTDLEIPSLIDIKDSDFPGIQMVSESSINGLVPYSLHYPKTPYDSVNEQINKYIEDSKNNYITALNEKNEKNKVKTIGQLDISTEIYEYKNQYYSIVFKKNTSLNKYSYTEATKTIVFNKKTGEIIQSRTLFNNNVGHLDVLSKYIRSELKHHYHDALVAEKLATATAPNWDKFNRFAIINDSIVFYYNQDEIAVSEIGAPTLSLPISFLNPILASDFQSKEKSEETIVHQKDAKKVALTFDDGPHPQVTKQILNILEKYNAKGTFFMLGSQVEKNREVAQEVMKRGHEVGNHSYNHPQLTKKSASEVTWQIDHTNQIIHDVTGEYPTVFRPPYGAKNQQVESAVNVPIILWSVDTNDWKYRDANKLLPVVKENVKDGSIILMHDIHQSTADGLESVLKYLQQQGYECVTVSELLADQD